MALFDTSVVVAYYCPEKMSEKAERILQAEEKPLISSLVQVEIASALARKVRERNLGKGDAGRIWAEFRSHLVMQGFLVKPVEPHHYERATNWIISFAAPLRSLDALHLAVSAELGETLITADPSMAKAAKLLGIRHRLVS